MGESLDEYATYAIQEGEAWERVKTEVRAWGHGGTMSRDVANAIHKYLELTGELDES